MESLNLEQCTEGKGTMSIYCKLELVILVRQRRCLINKYLFVYNLVSSRITWRTDHFESSKGNTTLPPDNSKEKVSSLVEITGIFMYLNPIQCFNILCLLKPMRYTIFLSNHLPIVCSNFQFLKLSTW